MEREESSMGIEQKGIKIFIIKFMKQVINLAPKDFRWLTISVVIGIVLGQGLTAIHAWTNPEALPPGSNVSPTINTTSEIQIKKGGLVVNSKSVAAVGLVVNNGIDVYEGDVTFVSSLASGQSEDDGFGPEHYGYNDNPIGICTNCGPSYDLHYARGTKSSPTLPADYEEIGAVSFSSFNTQTYSFMHSALIAVEASASQSSVIGDVPADIVFYTVENVSVPPALPMTEKMRLSHNGFVGIGLDEYRESGDPHTSQIDPDAPVHVKSTDSSSCRPASNVAIRITEDGLLDWNKEFVDIGVNDEGDLRFFRDNENRVGWPQDLLTLKILDSNGYVGVADSDPSKRLELPNVAAREGRGRANAWLTYSSRRWKENIVPIDNALEKISRLSGVYYDWKEDHGGAHDIGFIAEDVAEVLPEVVNFAENGVDADSLDYARITALNLEGIKELKDRVETRREEIESLRSIVCADHPEADVCQ